MSLDSKTIIFDKNINNNLSNSECKIFIKDYKDYKKGVVSKIINPKTNKALNDEDRIKYIYDKCKKKLGIEGSQSPKSKSPELEDNRVILDSYEKVRDILYIPFKSLNVNKKLITSLFAKPISYKQGLLALKEYLSNTNTHNIYVKSYNKILFEIDNIINSIYNNSSRDDKIVLRTQHAWIENYMYNPFVTSETYLPNMLYNINYINKKDIIGSKLSNIPLNEVRNILFYSSTNKNKADIIKNLNNNIEKYIALQFIIIMIRDKLDNVLYKNDNEKYIKIHLDILDSLITKNIVNGLYDNDHSKSISDSISWSGTPRSSSSGHSHFQSKANIERYKKTKADLVAEITENNINDMDPYLAERWEDMPLKKLRNVISIKHTEGTNTYGVAFYIRTLYQAWRNSVIYNKPFKNPYTRKEFTDNDKYDIMDAMEILYPNITLPKYNGRNDIILETTNNYINGNIYINYIFKYKLNAGIENDRILINILSFSIPLQFDVDIEPDYIQHYLFENISYLLKKNKLFGKSIPLKIIPSIHLPLGRSFTISRNNYAEYKIFFDRIKNAL